MESPTSQHFCLRWNNYRANLTAVFAQLLRSKLFVDVTLSVDGGCTIKAHKVILSACSPFFQALLSESKCEHPLIIVRGVTESEIVALVQFMYRGEISVSQEQLPSLLKVAEMLKVRGLAEIPEDEDDEEDDGVEEEGGNSPIIKGISDHQDKEDLGDDTGTEDKDCDRNSISPIIIAARPTQACSNNEVEVTENSDVIYRAACRSVSPKEAAEVLDASTDLSRPASPEIIIYPSEESASRSTLPVPSSSSLASLVSAQSSSSSAAMDTSQCSVSVIRVRSPLAHSPPQRLASDSGTKADPATGSSASQARRDPEGTSAQQRFLNSISRQLTDEVEIRPAIAEMIKEEERAKMLDQVASWNRSPDTTFQHQLQRAWQKSWNQHQGIMQNVRFRERGPLKTWRPETMAEAILCVLREGQSLSQAARKYDIPYPTFVLYANRVHNLLGPSLDNSGDLRPKGRGRPQRILLGNWPDSTVRSVIRAVVFRDTNALKHHMAQNKAHTMRTQMNSARHYSPLNSHQLPHRIHATGSAGQSIPGPLPFPVMSLPSATPTTGSTVTAAHHMLNSSAVAMAAAAAAKLPGQTPHPPHLLGLHNLQMMMGLLRPGAVPPSASSLSHSGVVPRIRLPMVPPNMSAPLPAHNNNNGGLPSSSTRPVPAALSLNNADVGLALLTSGGMSNNYNFSSTSTHNSRHSPVMKGSNFDTDISSNNDELIDLSERSTALSDTEDRSLNLGPSTDDFSAGATDSITTPSVDKLIQRQFTMSPTGDADDSGSSNKMADDSDSETTPLALAETVLSFDDNVGDDDIDTIPTRRRDLDDATFSISSSQSVMPDIRPITGVPLAALHTSP